ncbi:Hypothetical protein A7982_10227 [Minicystis rosea]|nr:Hypothetical protein A7982_10227 [Minicystis rosea]
MRAVAATLVLTIAACSAADAPVARDRLTSFDEGRTDHAPADELIGGAKAHLLGFNTGEAACAGLVTAGCWGVAGACAVLEVITVGGVTIPCSAALPIACVGATFGMAACAGLCG